MTDSDAGDKLAGRSPPTKGRLKVSREMLTPLGEVAKRQVAGGAMDTTDNTCNSCWETCNSMNDWTCPNASCDTCHTCPQESCANTCDMSACDVTVCTCGGGTCNPYTGDDDTCQAVFTCDGNVDCSFIECPDPPPPPSNCIC